mgnify:CR=1 FL=1
MVRDYFRPAKSLKFTSTGAPPVAGRFVLNDDCPAPVHGDLRSASTRQLIKHYSCKRQHWDAPISRLASDHRRNPNVIMRQKKEAEDNAVHKHFSRFICLDANFGHKLKSRHYRESHANPLTSKLQSNKLSAMPKRANSFCIKHFLDQWLATEDTLPLFKPTLNFWNCSAPVSPHFFPQW